MHEIVEYVPPGIKGPIVLSFRWDLTLPVITMKVLINDKMAVEAVDMLSREHEVTAHHYEMEDLVEVIEEYDALLVRSATKVHDPRIFENGKNLKVLGRAGVGTDNIDVARATELGIPVVFAPTGCTISVAELSVGHMLAFARHIVEGSNTMKEGRWEKSRLGGTELHGKTLGLLGCGNIGQETARLTRAFGMKIIYYRRNRDLAFENDIGAEYVTFEDLVERSDYLSLHLPRTDLTAGMISDDQFRKMKKSAVLINCARGGVVDEGALCRALESGEIAGAAVDVFEKEPTPADNPLLSMPNIIFTPHLGASTREAQIRAGTMTAQGILDVLAGKRPEYCKNPEVL